MTIAVYFDLDGTLCSYTRPFDEQFAATVEPYGTPTDDAYEVYVDRLFEALGNCESDPYRRAFEAVAETIDLDATPATLARDHCETELDATAVPADAKLVFERVAETNPTGILTNGDGAQQRAKIDRHGLDDLVDEVIVSNDAGARKPDRRIFDLARERLPADDHVYVGDTYEEDIVGARSAGFRTVYVADDRGEDPVETGAADAVASSVDDLLDPSALPEAIQEPFAPSNPK
ncbi:HAD family hydrolase [Halosolutus gelatinilyticus]|uniref:HAD family hydrolase n=1 Tax=Halosolutus gelatinilyticus TaxID=2931975 RepID=UPI001FF2248E|nr:HAD family hydrolase [Halosolutus gelatinilyticus]